MAINPTPESSGGVFSAIKDSLGLFSSTNKYSDSIEGQNPQPLDEYESSLSEVEIMELVSQWKHSYSNYYKEIEKGQKLSFDYWIGKHKNEDQTGVDITGSTDNLIFEAVETFLPIATRSNPEPLVSADPSEIGQKIAHDIKVALVNWADTQLLRRKLAKATRGWLLNRIGVLKVNWNTVTKVIELNVVNPKQMIFDKDGYVDERGIFIGEFVGERKQATAKTLIELFPKKKDIITRKAQGKMGTKLNYIEWWYQNTDVFFTIDDTLLGKFKNHLWNYDIEPKEATEPIVDPETRVVLREGQQASEGSKGFNHLKEMTNPYRFLGIFSTGEQPHDNTSLILQNIPIQDTINRRERQIDFNVKRMNNGGIVSGDFYTEEQASQAAQAFARGVFVRQPSGDVNRGFREVNAPPMPADVFNHLRDSRSELRNIFGTAGSSAEGVKSQESVRGKILVNQMDSSRIGGGITEYIEQVADSIYNLVVQFMFVYYDEEHFVTSAGSVAGPELIALKNDNFPLLRTLTITVKEGTLVPKDPLTQRNEAVDLWSQNAIDPLSLYKKLDFPDPAEAANQLILWQMLQKGAIQPQMYLPSFKVGGVQAGLPQEQPATGGNAVNAPTGPDTQPNQPIGTQPPEAQASQQLLGSVKI